MANRIIYKSAYFIHGRRVSRREYLSFQNKKSMTNWRGGNTPVIHTAYHQRNFR